MYAIQYKNFGRSFFLSQLRRLTDGQTEDGQMDGNLVTNTALHIMQRGKNTFVGCIL